MSESRYCDWIALDWGNSRLRAWAMVGDRPRAEIATEAGVAACSGDFEAALLAAVGDWLGQGRTEVLACGAVGAREGWVEVPYRPVPCPPRPDRARAAPARDGRLDVRVLPGLSQADPPGVMRGEETLLAGLLAREPGFDGVVCLPGTHDVWAQISAGEVVSFRSFMTGELFALVGGCSTVAPAIGEGWDEAAFAEAVADGLSRPEQMAARLFGLRAAWLLTDADRDAARARLSGWLIGAELAASRPYWLGQRVAVVGAPALADAHVAALAMQGIAAERFAASDLAVAGLVAARAALAG